MNSEGGKEGKEEDAMPITMQRILVQFSTVELIREANVLPIEGTEQGKQSRDGGEGGETQCKREGRRRKTKTRYLYFGLDLCTVK